MTSRLRPYGEAIVQGVSSAKGNPLRAALGALAVAVAVATIVVVVTALDGLVRYARTTGARAFGSDSFLLAQIATAGQSTRRELADKQQRNPAITRTDLRFLERHAGSDLVYASTVQRAGDVTAGARTYENAAISGTTSTLAELRDLGIARGRFFQRDEDLRRDRLDHAHDEIAPVARRGDVEERELVGALLVVAPRDFNRIACVAQADEIDSLHHAPGGDIETGNDALRETHQPSFFFESSSASFCAFAKSSFPS